MERLDELSKLLAVSVSRRESLRSIGVVLAGAVLSPRGVSATPAKTTPMLRSDSRRDTDTASNFDNSSRRSMIDTSLRFQGMWMVINRFRSLRFSLNRSRKIH